LLGKRLQAFKEPFEGSRVYFVLLPFNQEMTTPSGAICAEAESKMLKFLITATVATVTLAALIAGVSTKALSSTDFTPPPSAAGVAGGGARVRFGEPPPSVPACWDDKSGLPHCYA
jgi:hypothetical protein